MVDENGRPRLKPNTDKPQLNPLDVDELDVGLTDGATHAFVLSPKTGNAMAITDAVLADARRWALQHSATFHLSHFATCPERDKFRR
jgi:hypothetical protein